MKCIGWNITALLDYELLEKRKLMAWVVLTMIKGCPQTIGKWGDVPKVLIGHLFDEMHRVKY